MKGILIVLKIINSKINITIFIILKNDIINIEMIKIMYILEWK